MTEKTVVTRISIEGLGAFVQFYFWQWWSKGFGYLCSAVPTLYVFLFVGVCKFWAV